MFSATPDFSSMASKPFGPARDLLARVVGREHLSQAQAAQLFSYVLDEGTTDAQVAAILCALATKAETAEELAGMAEVMRARSRRIRCAHPVWVDTAGTGGSGCKAFNVSTAASFVIAGAGVPVAKHGNAAVSSRTGSADVLRSLGVNIAAAPAVTERCLEEHGICFLFAPLYHAACARAAAIRRQLGIPTAFNALGPLANPAGAPCQVIGVPEARRAAVMARALARLGTRRSWVVSGAAGEDEISAAGATHVWNISSDGAVVEQEITPEDFGVRRETTPVRRVEDAAESAAVIRQVLARRPGGERTLVLLNAAAALYVAGAAANLREAAQRAAESLDSGAAWGKLESLVRATAGGEP